MDSKRYFLTHIIPATTSILSLLLLLAAVYYGMYEQWVYAVICLIGIVLDFYIYLVLTKLIDKKYSGGTQVAKDKPTTLKD